MTPQVAALAPAPKAVIDVRTVPPPQRHPLFFATFDQLAVGETMVLVNDHDPRPLRMQFEVLAANRFQWDYLEAGPTRWQVKITRTQPTPPGQEAARMLPNHGFTCGGHGHTHGAAPAPAPVLLRPADQAQFRPERFNPLVLAGSPRMKVILACFEAGQFIPVHSPGIDLALYVLDGRGQCQVGAEERPLTAGDLMFVPAGEKRGVKAETRMTVLHVVSPPPTEADHGEVQTGLKLGTWKPA